MFTPRCTQLHCGVSLWVAQEKIPVLCDAQNNKGIAVSLLIFICHVDASRSIVNSQGRSLLAPLNRASKV